MNSDIIAFNKDQVQHVQILQKLVLQFVNDIMKESIEHDTSKWGDVEYTTFVNSRKDLNNSKNGTDANYQKNLTSEAIQHHYKNNKHHPEYWKDKENSMPVEEIIIMFFDWASRTIAKGGMLVDFWEYNISKLRECKQHHAIPIVDGLRDKYESIIVSMII